MDVEDGIPRIPRPRRVRTRTASRYPFSLSRHVMEIHGEHYRTTFPDIHLSVFLLVLSLSECILEEHGSPGVEVLVLSLVLRI